MEVIIIKIVIILVIFIRIIITTIIVLLIARLVLDPSRLLMLRGASMHHVVLLDDSLSMRDREGDSSVFQEALTTLENMLAEGSRQPGASRVTILSITDPRRPIVSERTLDGALVQELLPRLRCCRIASRTQVLSWPLVFGEQHSSLLVMSWSSLKHKSMSCIAVWWVALAIWLFAI